jgi:hypothetical protein
MDLLVCLFTADVLPAALHHRRLYCLKRLFTEDARHCPVRCIRTPPDHFTIAACTASFA